MSNKPVDEKKVAAATAEAPAAAAKKPEDVPDDQLEAVAGGHGHERWYHHDHDGRRGYYRNGAFINLNI